MKIQLFQINGTDQDKWRDFFVCGQRAEYKSTILFMIAEIMCFMSFFFIVKYFYVKIVVLRNIYACDFLACKQ